MTRAQGDGDSLQISAIRRVSALALIGIILAVSITSLSIINAVEKTLAEERQLRSEQDLVASTAREFERFSSQFAVVRSGAGAAAIPDCRVHLDMTRTLLDSLAKTDWSGARGGSIAELRKDERRLRTSLYAYADTLEQEDTEEYTGRALREIDRVMPVAMERVMRWRRHNMDSIEVKSNMLSRATHRAGAILVIVTGCGCVIAAGIVIGTGRRTTNLLARLEDARSQLQHEAAHDALTALPNRSLLVEEIESVAGRLRARRTGTMAVLYMDVDNFKAVNDTLGHEVGDGVLCEVATRLAEVIPCVETTEGAERLIGRLGGDEFVVLLEGVDGDGAARLAGLIQERMTPPFQCAQRQLYFSLSIGIAIGDGSSDASTMMREADIAMYRAKLDGKGQHALFDKAMSEVITRELRVENDLRWALRRNELSLVYQPIVELQSGDIAGFETLIRWNHTLLGPIPPKEFISIAERTGSIAEIGSWVLRRACEQLAEWNEELPARRTTVAVNVSRSQLLAGGLPDEVAGVLESTGVAANQLKLEITEGVVADGAARIRPILDELRALGVELHMDDFGTGSSSLSCLHEFPFSVVKLDRAFLVTTVNDREYAAVVDAVVNLAHLLGMQATCEGIEEAAQVSMMLALECDYGQGFHFARPVDALTARRMLESGAPWRHRPAA